MAVATGFVAFGSLKWGQFRKVDARVPVLIYPANCQSTLERGLEATIADPGAIQEPKRWDQLEADPELAGPWHQLFKQVQSPRHILSELLQNADDAGASEARVSIENDRFVFEHNGEDFIEAHFASICRFGYSNKRALHTIGFRGSDSRARSAWAIGSSCSRRPWR
jgi:hypothetical protein